VSAEPLALPPCWRGALDLAGLTALVEAAVAADAAAECQLRAGPGARAAATAPADALRALAEGAADGLQLRYRWRGEAWIDTARRSAAGFAVVRMVAPRWPEQGGGGR
jgi:hypothetical protein